jgi:hypothetical protein
MIRKVYYYNKNEQKSRRPEKNITGRGEGDIEDLCS